MASDRIALLGFLLFLTTLLAAGCRRGTPHEAIAPPEPGRGAEAMKRNADAISRFDHILEMLWDMDEKVRQTGMKDLTGFRKDLNDPGSQIGLKKGPANDGSSRRYLQYLHEVGLRDSG
jgi:hypothetical protein